MINKQNISVNSTLRLEKLFYTGPQFWLTLQTTNKLNIVKVGNGPYLTACYFDVIYDLYQGSNDLSFSFDDKVSTL